MVGYIKSGADFATRQRIEIVSYSAYLRTGNGDTSSISIVGGTSAELGDYLLYNGYIWVITAVTPNDGITNIQCADVSTLFDRKTVLPQGTVPIHEMAFMGKILREEYVECNDPLYAMPYLRVITEGYPAIGFVRPELDEYRMYTLTEYMERARRIADTIITFAYTNINLTAHISLVYGSRQIDFADGQHELISETYASDITAKITTIRRPEVGGGYRYTDYYLVADGSITQDANATERVRGGWEYIKGGDDEEADVKDKFARNTYSHQIVFRSPKIYNWGSGVKIRMLDGRIITSRITAIMDDGGDMLTYTAGEARVTLTEILQGVAR